MKILKELQDDASQYQEFLQEVSIMRKVCVCVCHRVYLVVLLSWQLEQRTVWRVRHLHIGSSHLLSCQICV